MVRYTLHVAKEEIKVMAKIELVKQQRESNTFSRGRTIYFVLTGIAVAAAIVFNYSRYAVTICAALAAGCLYTAVYGWKRQFLRTREQHIRRTIMRTPDLPREYVFTEEQIQIISERTSGSLQWNTIEGFGQIKHYLYLLCSNNSLLLVDENRLSGEEREELCRMLKKHRIPEFKA
ncbi:MAG: YcxB family protein [Anaerovoracaceae bacterium]